MFPLPLPRPLPLPLPGDPSSLGSIGFHNFHWGSDPTPPTPPKHMQMCWQVDICSKYEYLEHNHGSGNCYTKLGRTKCVVGISLLCKGCSSCCVIISPIVIRSCCLTILMRPSFADFAKCPLTEGSGMITGKAKNTENIRN